MRGRAGVRGSKPPKSLCLQKPQKSLDNGNWDSSRISHLEAMGRGIEGPRVPGDSILGRRPEPGAGMISFAATVLGSDTGRGPVYKVLSLSNRILCLPLLYRRGHRCTQSRDLPEDSIQSCNVSPGGDSVLEHLYSTRRRPVSEGKWPSALGQAETGEGHLLGKQ